MLQANDGAWGEVPSRFVPAPEVMPPSYTPGHSQNQSGHREPSATPLMDSHTPPKRQSFFSSVLQTITIFAVALLCVVVVKTFVVQSFFVPSGSMEATIMTGDYVAVNKLVNKASEIERGDIVVFEDPGGWLEGVHQPQQSKASELAATIGKALGLVPKNSGSHLVKRVIGVGGDRVVCCDDNGLISVNGQAISESYLPEDMEPSSEPFDVTVPHGYLWVMGDNRSNSADSRFHQAQAGSGFVPVSKVAGRVWLIYYPFDRFGQVHSAHSVFAEVPNTAASVEQEEE